mmetsp:Transcript_455/g.1264  ORF Transcript_455/g.1264 Transcript_455/m.1264 type:complete len:211 (+) Transcript_455:1245-1877(+)
MRCSSRPPPRARRRSRPRPSRRCARAPPPWRLCAPSVPHSRPPWVGPFVWTPPPPRAQGRCSREACPAAARTPWPRPSPSWRARWCGLTSSPPWRCASTPNPRNQRRALWRRKRSPRSAKLLPKCAMPSQGTHSSAGPPSSKSCGRPRPPCASCSFAAGPGASTPPCTTRSLRATLSSLQTRLSSPVSAEQGSGSRARRQMPWYAPFSTW